jgi:uncharacterized repeat protein (TIGR03803 family)
MSSKCFSAAREQAAPLMITIALAFATAGQIALAQIQPSGGGSARVQQVVFDVIYTFPLTDRYTPNPLGLIQDTNGNFYGATTYGGDAKFQCPVGCGTVFELSPQSDGSWSEEVLYNFGATRRNDGIFPESGLVMDSVGNLYGTTYEGGDFNKGSAFELSPQPDGTWTGQLLYVFGGAPGDGGFPRGSLVFDSDGNLYGATRSTVFELSPTTGGKWTETILHTFGGPSDGSGPNGNLIWGPDNNIYGTTTAGGNTNDCPIDAIGCGTVFELSRHDGDWQESLLYTFQAPSDGSSPTAPLVFDSAGNLYGETVFGGSGGCRRTMGCGTIFELSPEAGGVWSKSTLWNFVPERGALPEGGLIIDEEGALYGTTAGGGGSDECSGFGVNVGCGTAFTLRQRGDGEWVETVLQVFGGTNDIYGSFPQSGLMFGQNGNLYGTTTDTAFEISR